MLPNREQILSRACRACVMALALGSLLGCGGDGRVPVTGRVVRADGSPLVEARVIARCPDKGVSASGLTDSNGEYALGGMEKGDGVEPGEYAVTVSEDRGSWDSPRPRTIHHKYSNAKTSGLSFVAEPGTPITLNLELDQP